MRDLEVDSISKHRHARLWANVLNLQIGSKRQCSNHLSQAANWKCKNCKTNTNRWRSAATKTRAKNEKNSKSVNMLKYCSSRCSKSNLVLVSASIVNLRRLTSHSKIITSHHPSSSSNSSITSSHLSSSRVRISSRGSLISRIRGIYLLCLLKASSKILNRSTLDRHRVTDHQPLREVTNRCSSLPSNQPSLSTNPTSSLGINNLVSIQTSNHQKRTTVKSCSSKCKKQKTKSKRRKKTKQCTTNATTKTQQT